MIAKILRSFTGAALIGAAAAGAGIAQDTTNRVAIQDDWSVFEASDPKECFGVAAPSETVNTRDGQVVAATRGEILLFVTFRPGADVSGEVTFRGGYPFADGSTVSMQIGSDSFELFTENVRDGNGEQDGWAWPASPSQDAPIIAAMKRGAQAVLTGRSGRGTQTKDTFSLFGFTAAIEEAAKRCAS